MKPKKKMNVEQIEMLRTLQAAMNNKIIQTAIGENKMSVPLSYLQEVISTIQGILDYGREDLHEL